MGENLYGKLGPGWIAPGLTSTQLEEAVVVVPVQPEPPPAPPAPPVVVPIVDTVATSKAKIKPVFVDEDEQVVNPNK